MYLHPPQDAESAADAGLEGGTGGDAVNRDGTCTSHPSGTARDAKDGGARRQGGGARVALYVLRGLARMRPSLYAIPTPILFAEPSMPNASGMVRPASLWLECAPTEGSRL